ncbi:Hypothetical predicted protein [Podarcis lilfordi]|uniref:Uncharacterized protein n=1 Tax=Podarcis lilfordi TaxID=74358 RepID=A0AA35P1B7_9SAUR|nr:Hypothetical predicted protein [Podarcis lilfordi]
MGIMTGTPWGFSQSLAHLLAPRLAPCSALLLVVHLAAMLEQLEGELCAACPALCMRSLPADLASDDGPQRVVHTSWELHGDRPMKLLLLVKNAAAAFLYWHKYSLRSVGHLHPFHMYRYEGTQLQNPGGLKG